MQLAYCHAQQRVQHERTIGDAIQTDILHLDNSIVALVPYPLQALRTEECTMLSCKGKEQTRITTHCSGGSCGTELVSKAALVAA